MAVFGSNQGVFKMKTSIRSFNTKGLFSGIGAIKIGVGYDSVMMYSASAIGVGDISPTSAAARA